MKFVRNYFRVPSILISEDIADVISFFFTACEINQFVYQ